MGLEGGEGVGGCAALAGVIYGPGLGCISAAAVSTSTPSIHHLRMKEISPMGSEKTPHAYSAK